MKKILTFLALLIFAIRGIAQSETLTSDQNAIKTLIHKMYSIDPDVFEMGRFWEKRGENRRIIVRGKYAPLRQCQLLAEFLSKEAVIKEKDQSCMTGVDGFFRYPGIDVDGEGAHDTPPSSPRINTPVINGGQAKVYVEFKYGGNIFYYLKKLPEGWRIYRVESRANDDWRSENKEVRVRADEATIFPPEKPPTKKSQVAADPHHPRWLEGLTPKDLITITNKPIFEVTVNEPSKVPPEKIASQLVLYFEEHNQKETADVIRRCAATDRLRELGAKSKCNNLSTEDYSDQECAVKAGYWKGHLNNTMQASSIDLNETKGSGLDS